MVKAAGYIDGVVAPLAEIRIPVMDRGFLYGDSIYEVLRTYAGIPFMFDEHYQRLQKSAALARMSISQSKAEIIAAIKATVAFAEPAVGEDVYVRYQITRGEGPVDLYPDPSLQSRLIIIVKALPQWPESSYQQGVTVAVTELQRNSINSLDPNIKGGNYLNNILALTEAKEKGVDDCLMLDAGGWVTECSNSNIWFVIDGALVTPLAGNLQGLTRRTLVELLAGAGYQNLERPIHHDELLQASECFITSATREIMPVSRLLLADGRSVSFPPGGGELTRQARQCYQQMLAEFVARHSEQRWF